MAGDLERMGRELKCPICLSLLNSAVSLNCNHVFCNSCIVKSMKSDSNCPVCKVPYRRREVRPVPHMDNLVSIYKSMEIASGMNIFITQNAPSTKLSDEKQQVEDRKNLDRQDSGQIFVEKQNTFKEQGSREQNNSDVKSFGSVHGKPSFPTKKRVQVPYSQSEGDLGENVDKLFEKSSRILKKPFTDEKGGPGLSPFFWLRDDENVENLSQQTSTDPFDDIPVPNAPTFSDIKDSDSENLSQSIPEGEMPGKSSNAVDMFDSEMFEWTQRACSPELCSSPFKTQVADNDETDVVEEKDLKVASQNRKRGKAVSAGNVAFVNMKEDDRCTDELTEISSLGTKNTNDQACGKNSKKRGRKARQKVGTACPVESVNQGLGTNVDSKERSENIFHTYKRSEKVCAISVSAETLDDGKENMRTELPDSFTKKKRCNEDFTSKKTGNNFKRIHLQNQIQHPVSSKKPRFDIIHNEVSNERNQTNKDNIAELSALLVPLAKEGKALESMEKPRKLSKKAKSSDDSDNSKDDKFEEAQTTGSIENNLECRSLADSSIVKKLPSLTKDVGLQRCENIPSKIQCVFCLSSEESEASGEMLHYYNGRPVAADYNGGSEVIHSHKNCTEWAPNVYFENDVAINLEAELTRSRRIKCSCCGTRGAALGCYEKSCRKSFHVPCAKMMLQCRWDTVNFVMLCPLHPSSKFPGECFESQVKKRTCSPKKLASVQQNKVTVKHDLGTSPDWSSCGSPKKLVICCSALTNSEREIVSEFERISGVTVSKKWESNVTHVIASTDESGACKRTLKVLMGILDGKWILSIKWIQACMEAMKLVDEECFEITVDTHGIRDGPRLGRLRVQNKGSKLFDGFKLYFMGQFESSYKGYLQDLITAAGGTILHRKPVSGHRKDSTSSSSTCQTFIVYSLELPDQSDPTKRNMIFNRRLLDAEALASSFGAEVVSNSWVLNSIAACKLQSLSE